MYMLKSVCFVGCGRTCLSCSDVGSVHECSDVEVCADDEVNLHKKLGMETYLKY